MNEELKRVLEYLFGSAIISIGIVISQIGLLILCGFLEMTGFLDGLRLTFLMWIASTVSFFLITTWLNKPKSK